MRAKYTPTYEELEAAHKIYLTNEPRDLFYKAATELIDLSINHKTSLSLTDSLMVLLQTWNKSFYRFHTKLDDEHIAKTDELLNRFLIQIKEYRQRSIMSLEKTDGPTVDRLFNSFERVLGPVGASKALHLLAPRFFPIFDNDIAKKGYSIYFERQGHNISVYSEYVQIVLGQCVDIINKNPTSPKDNILKLLDEFNYCKYTKNLIK